MVSYYGDLADSSSFRKKSVERSLGTGRGLGIRPRDKCRGRFLSKGASDSKKLTQKL